MDEEASLKATLDEIRRNATTKTIGMESDAVIRQIAKENGRIMYHLQEAIDLIEEDNPESSLANENVYCFKAPFGSKAYFEALVQIVVSIHNEMQMLNSENELREKVRVHMQEYLKILSRLDGILEGLSLIDSYTALLPDEPRKKRKFDLD